MAMFNCYVSSPEGIPFGNFHGKQWCLNHVILVVPDSKTQNHIPLVAPLRTCRVTEPSDWMVFHKIPSVGPHKNRWWSRPWPLVGQICPPCCSWNIPYVCWLIFRIHGGTLPPICPISCTNSASFISLVAETQVRNPPGFFLETLNIGYPNKSHGSSSCSEVFSLSIPLLTYRNM